MAILLLLFLGAVGAYLSGSPSGTSSDQESPSGWFPVGVGALLSLFAYLGWTAIRKDQRRRAGDAAAKHRHKARMAAMRADFEREQDRWLEAKAAFDALPNWYGVVPRPDTHHLEIVGGNPRSWSAFLTVFGASVVQSGDRMTVLDLTEVGAGAGLRSTLLRAGVDVDVVRLPEALGDAGLLAGMTPTELVDVLCGVTIAGDPDAGRALQSIDRFILHSLIDCLDGPVTVRRIVDALRTVLRGGEPVVDSLSDSERSAIYASIATEVRGVPDSMGRVSRMVAQLYPLSAAGDGGDIPRQSQVRIYSVDGAGAPAVSAGLGDLCLSAFQRSLRIGLKSSPYRNLVCVLGCDDLSSRQLLDTLRFGVAERVTFVFFFERFTPELDALLGVGGSALGILRLASDTDAGRAVDFAGRAFSYSVADVTVKGVRPELLFIASTYDEMVEQQRQLISSRAQTAAGVSIDDTTQQFWLDQYVARIAHHQVSDELADALTSRAAWTVRPEHVDVVNAEQLRDLPDTTCILVEFGAGSSTRRCRSADFNALINFSGRTTNWERSNS